MSAGRQLPERVNPWQATPVLSSRDNRWLKRFRAALRGGKPAPDGYIGIEGVRLVEEALRSGLAVEAVLASRSGEHHLGPLAQWLSPGVHLLRTSDTLFASVADTETPQGVAALVRPREATFDDLVGGVPLVVVLVGVQDPGNVGTILRAAEAFDATGIATCAAGHLGTAYPFGPKALRASAGSALRLPILHGVAVSVLLAQLRVAGLKTYAASLSEGIAPVAADLRRPATLLIGNEGAGLPPEVERSADERVRIPIAAGVDSLNAAMAAAVLLYEAARQRAEWSRSPGLPESPALRPPH